MGGGGGGGGVSGRWEGVRWGGGEVRGGGGRHGLITECTEDLIGRAIIIYNRIRIEIKETNGFMRGTKTQ